MKLQLALDDVTLEQADALINQVQEAVQIVEIGTPMIIAYGMRAVRMVKERFPKLEVTVDAKIMDAGYYEARQCLEAGGDIVTVMGFTHDETILGAVKAAQEFGASVMADMMCVENLTERAKRLTELGVTYICVHTAVDVQGRENPYGELKALRHALPKVRCCIAGGVNADSIQEIVKLGPEIIIVGGGITKAENPEEVAKKLTRAIQSDTGFCE